MWESGVLCPCSLTSMILPCFKYYLTLLFFFSRKLNKLNKPPLGLVFALLPLPRMAGLIFHRATSTKIHRSTRIFFFSIFLLPWFLLLWRKRIQSFYSSCWNKEILISLPEVFCNILLGVFHKSLLGSCTLKKSTSCHFYAFWERRRDIDRDFPITFCLLLLYGNLRHIYCKMWVALVCYAINNAFPSSCKQKK